MAFNSKSTKGHGKGRGHADSISLKMQIQGDISNKLSAPRLINSQLISAAETGDLELLLCTTQAWMARMNLVNLSTALHRLAKLSSGLKATQEQLRSHALIPVILDRLRSEVGGPEAQSNDVNCQALSNITWSLATLQLADLPLLTDVAAQALRGTASFKPFELSAMLWGFAKLREVDVAACECALPLFQSIAADFPQRVEQFTFSSLAYTTWAFATAGFRDPVLFEVIAKKMVPLLQRSKSCSCHEITDVAWAFSTTGAPQAMLFGELSRKAMLRLREFSAKEILTLLSGCASSGVYHEDFVAAAGFALQSVELDAPQLSEALWAFARMRSKKTETAVLRLIVQCTMQVSTMTPEELSSVTLSASLCFGRNSGDVQGPAESPSPLPSQVREFFSMALPRALALLEDLNGQALANIAYSYISVGMATETPLYPTLARVVLSRKESLESPALVLLHRIFQEAPHCEHVVRALHNEALARSKSTMGDQTPGSDFEGGAACRRSSIFSEDTRSGSSSDEGEGDATEKFHVKQKNTFLCFFEEHSCSDAEDIPCAPLRPRCQSL